MTERGELEMLHSTNNDDGVIYLVSELLLSLVD
jgi:hypothetical protein